MFSVNQLSNGQRPNISNRVQTNRVAVAFCIAITIVIIVSSLLFAGLMLSYGRGSSVISEVDTTAPLLQCTDSITVTVPLGTPGTSVTWLSPTATDNSGTVSILSNNYQSGDFFPVGVTTVTYTFGDPSLNTATCTWTVTVNEVDTTAPLLQCTDSITVTVPLGTPGTSVTWRAPTATDDSGTVYCLSKTHQSGDFFPVGETTVIYTFGDPSQNTDICIWTVTVIEGEFCDENDLNKGVNMECEIDGDPFNKTYIGYLTSPFTSPCHMVKAPCQPQTGLNFPNPINDLKACIDYLLGTMTGFTYTYPYPGTAPSNVGVTHVLVNSCHGCLCLEIEVAAAMFVLGCSGGIGIIAPRICDVPEGGNVLVNVTKTGTGASSVDIQIDGQTATAGVDYQVITPFTDPLDFGPGDQEMIISIDVEDDDVVEGDETFEVQLSNPSSGTIENPILTITIIDND